MSATATENFVLDNFTAIDFLAGDGKTVLLNDVSWAEYETFLKDFEERAGWRLAYDRGKLEIMPPIYEHEYFGFTFHDFVRAYCDELDLELVGARSTTFRREFLAKGVEPDECYYIQNAKNALEKNFSTRNYIVPDVAVEIDVTTESLDKFPIYAALEVPEVWIYDGEKVSFYELEVENYRRISHSRALPLLPAEKLGEFLEISRAKGQTFALKSFRAWLRLEVK